jgi:hypothetical protein
MSYDALVDWSLHTPVSEFLRAAEWRLAAADTLHLAGMLVWFSTVLVVDLRLLGRVLVEQPTAEIAHGVGPFGRAALIAQAITGTALFLATVVKTAMSVAFMVKLILLTIALTYHFSLHRRAVQGTIQRDGHVRAIAAGSLALWFGVVLAGLWIDI